MRPTAVDGGALGAATGAGAGGAPPPRATGGGAASAGAAAALWRRRRLGAAPLPMFLSARVSSAARWRSNSAASAIAVRSL